MLPRRFGPGCGCLFCVPAVATAHYTTPLPHHAPFVYSTHKQQQQQQQQHSPVVPFGRDSTLYFLLLFDFRGRAFGFSFHLTRPPMFLRQHCVNKSPGSGRVYPPPASPPPPAPPPWPDLCLWLNRTLTDIVVSIRSERTFCRVRNALTEPFYRPRPWPRPSVCAHQKISI